MPEPAVADSVYAYNLWKLKHGHPLWVPEPTIPDRPVAIGDVGYIKRGAFYPLFNICRPAEEQEVLGVPDDFEPLPLRDTDRCVMPNFFQPKPLFNTSVTRLDVNVEATADIVQAGAGIRFHCYNKVGAVLVLQSHAIREDALPLRRFTEYAKRHHPNWMPFAIGQHARDITGNDLLLVTGCDHTATWSAAAFTEAQRGASIFFRGGYSTLAGGGLTLQGTWDTFTTAEYRSNTSPNEVIHGSPDATSQEPIQRPMDQCVFVRGYKIRYRPFFGPKAIKAGAEAKHERRWPDEGSENNIVLNQEEDLMEIESMGSEPTYDPLDVLLEYMLQHSDASVVIAGHHDLIQMFKDYDELPDDVHSRIVTIAPKIEVNEVGVGTLQWFGQDLHEIPKQGRLPQHVSDSLKDWLYRHAEHPYPSEEETKQLCHTTGLSTGQVSNWMTNARRRILAPARRRAAAVAAAGSPYETQTASHTHQPLEAGERASMLTPGMAHSAHRLASSPPANHHPDSA